ncbi:gamma-glutamyltransferase [Cytobacillus firmus]|uniref:gamma-glutamyltransferase family protein n=1 Tax=Cytobacillus firmus TaxID=1399 RepID=UPI00077CA7BF|nr:gamma-glutamyltransferase family protein [Cytobacillus firmus]MBG9542318.1 gamma-glutamyltransferase [Cytobacillus firmus]MBG9553547.1 gamma-glutamyltransferase [Cytobacillus firmus]MBG9557731.1 gamma-glutamyltransferase [Cytobacillus firmus]MBG9573919.1 gamma-glutamyltransferase [Cytobacillus firmus]MEC1893934.1 gamma-glutamyltransferase family protein [Cytobacillus firmus]
MNFDFQNHPYPSQRTTVMANNGMVATSQPLAAQAGLEIMKKGGNAIDAAIATAAALTVVEPTSNGIGGDAFALVWTKGELHGLNASGPAPKSISIEALKERGIDKMPTHGWMPVTVPGAPSAWAELSKRFGRLPLKEVLQPAIDYAENGYPLTPILGKYWQYAYKKFKQILTDDEFQHWFETFAPDGRAPGVGEIWRSEGHAATLRAIGETDGESFYRGETADKIDAFSKKYNAFLSKEDLEDYKAEWVDPIKVNYRGYDVWEIPPNGQGLVALLGLNIAKGFEFSDKETADTYHKQIEAMKLAFTDGKAFITDPAEMKVTVEELLSEEYGESRRSEIGEEAVTPEPYQPPRGGTVYLAAADSEGNMVSFIQSNYMGFGSGLVVPGTGITLQNRGHDFSLDPEHHNALKPGKKTYHTIIPGFLTKDGEAVGPFGVMGGYMQPQGHMQVVMNTVDFHLNPQAALDAPRWQWIEGKKVQVEPHFPNHIAQALVRKGHQIEVTVDTGGFGRGQIIWRDPKTGVLMGGTEARTDGSIAAW